MKDFRNARGPEVLGLYQKCGLDATDSRGVGEAKGEHKRCTMAGGQSKLARPCSALVTLSIHPCWRISSWVGVTMHSSTSAKVLALQGESGAQCLEEPALSAGHFNLIAARSVRPSSQMPLLLSSPRMGLV